MKKIHFFIYSVCCALFALWGCEGATDQTTVPGSRSNEQINERTVEDCEECPVDYCCCLIELRTGTDFAVLALCGLSDGTYACGPFNPPGSCDDFSGDGETVTLYNTGPAGVAVCVEEGGVVRIENQTGGTVSIRFTCQYDLISPQWVNITLDNDDVIYFSTDGSCTLTEC